MLAATDTVLGIFKTWDCEAAECNPASCDLLACYTEGNTASFNHDAEESGEPRLRDSPRHHRALAPQDALASIVDEVLHFSPQEQHDDITLILAKCHE